MLIDINYLREVFGKSLVENASTRHSMDAALMAVAKTAYQAGAAAESEVMQTVNFRLTDVELDMIKEMIEKLEENGEMLAWVARQVFGIEEKAK